MSGTRVIVSALAAKSYGGDSYFRSFIPAMLKHAPEVELAFLALDDSYLKLVPDAARYEWHFFPEVRSLGSARVLWEQVRLGSILRRLNAGVYYSPMNTTVWGGGIPSVIAVRNMEPLTPAAAGVSVPHRLRNALLKRMTLISAARARSVVAVSGHVRDTLVGFGVSPEKISVIYHGIDDLPETGEVSRSPGPFMAVAAKFIRYSNLDVVVRAFARIRDAGYEGRFMIAGGPYDAGYKKEVLSLVETLGLSAQVQILGYVQRTEVLELMRTCEAFFFPSSVEACPFSLLEALRMGAPIVCSTAPPMPEFGGQAVVYAPPRDASAMAQAALRLVKDSAMRDAMRQSARERAAGFTWREHVRRLVAVLMSG